MRRDNNLRTRLPDKTRIMRRRRADGNAPFQFGILKSSGSGTAGPPAPKRGKRTKVEASPAGGGHEGQGDRSSPGAPGQGTRLESERSSLWLFRIRTPK